MAKDRPIDGLTNEDMCDLEFARFAVETRSAQSLREEASWSRPEMVAAADGQFTVPTLRSWEAALRRPRGARGAAYGRVLRVAEELGEVAREMKKDAQLIALARKACASGGAACLCEAFGETVEELAPLIDVDPSTLELWLAGDETPEGHAAARLGVWIQVWAYHLGLPLGVAH